MARTIAQGPPGLEVTHLLNGAYGSVTLNDLSARPGRVRLTDLRGYYSLADSDDNREPNIGRRGVSTYPSATRDKTIVYIGEVQGRTLDDLRQMTSQIKLALAGNRSNEMKVQIQDPEVPWFFDARVIDYEQDDEQKNGPTNIWPWTRTFQISFKLSDSRFYVDNGGAAYPSNAAGAAVNVNNEGQTDTEPKFLVQAALGTPVVIKNNTLGTQLRIAGHPSAAIVVNFATREITGPAGADFSRYLDEDNSTWWDEDQISLAPGVSNVQVTGAEWGVSFFHASE